jgi:hypothetical protein
MSPKFRSFNNKYLVPFAMLLMSGGFVALCQPWSEWLHAYSVTFTLIGLAIFTIFARFGSLSDKD